MTTVPSSKQCSTCREVKPASEFHASHRSRDGLQGNCKPCNTRQAQIAEWAKAGIDIDHDRYDAMFARQEGRCAICKQQSKGRRLAVDHDHEANRVRALLCLDCNTAIGKFREDVTIIRAAAEYLESHRRSG